jgi:hypothetical protein
MKELQEHPDNDIILGSVLANEIERARYEKSNHKVCDDLGIEYVGVEA